MMLIIGVTGQVGMGKSVVAGMLCQLGFRLYDADKHAHGLLLDKGVRKAVHKVFGGSDDGRLIDRQWLRARVLADTTKLRALEAILHPRLAVLRQRFLLQARLQHCRGVVLDVPLLFESNSHQHCHVVITASCPPFVQRERLKRRGLADNDIERFIALQMSDKEKRRRADYVIPTGQGYNLTRRLINQLARQGARRLRPKTRHRVTRPLAHRLRLLRYA